MSDPYQVLGIEPNATNEEVKKAYRDLSRKYHPDNVVNNPLADLAEEKFKEVQEAYKQIMDMRENGASGYSGGFNGSAGSSYGGAGSSSYSGGNAGGSSSSYGSQEDMLRFNSVRSYINGRRYREAVNVLSGITNRNGEWHYLYAVASAGIGNNVEAMNHARQAVTLEPSNREYSGFLDQLQMRTSRYQATGAGYGGRSNSDCGTGNICCDLWCADSLCECMGGDLCSCM